MESLGQNLRLIARKFNQFLNKELKDIDLSPAEIIYLDLLLEKDGLTQDELAKVASVDKAAITRVIQRLEKKEVVKRLQSETDKRANLIFLTEKAYRYKDILDTSRRKWFKILNVHLTDEEMKRLDTMVAEIAENVKKAVP